MDEHPPRRPNDNYSQSIGTVGLRTSMSRTLTLPATCANYFAHVGDELDAS